MSKDLIFLKKYFEAGIGNNADVDYAWLYTKYLPTLERAKNCIRTKEDERAISEAFYFLGDVYDFIDAPQSALKAYEASFRHHDNSSSACRELGIKCVQLGNFEKGIYFLELALLLNPHDKLIEKDIDSAYEDRDENIILYSKDDFGWRVVECLLSGKLNKAKYFITKLDKEMRWRFEAYFFAVENDVGSYIRRWESVAACDFEVELTYADFFFIPEIIWNNRRFWKLILSLEDRLIPGVFPIPDSLDQRRSSKELVQLYCNFQIARIDEDVLKLMELKKIAPEWQELDEYINEHLLVGKRVKKN